MARCCAAMIIGMLGLLVSQTSAYGSSLADPVPVTHVDRLLRIGKDGVVTQDERVLLRQIGLDKVAIAQVVKETRDGGRLTRAEAQQIMRGYRARNQKTDAELLDEICKRSPLYPPCKNR